MLNEIHNISDLLGLTVYRKDINNEASCKYQVRAKLEEVLASHDTPYLGACDS